MTLLECFAAVPSIILLALPIVVFVGRNWLQARITRGVQFSFDKQLEAVRSELHDVEERLKSELRIREAETTDLRSGALSGRAQRQALLAERRLQAVERVWAAAVALGPYRAVAGWMQSINVSAVSRLAPKNPEIRRLMEMISTLPADFKHDPVARQERPFVSPMAWAYYSAIQTTLLVIYAQAKILSIGMDKAGELIDSSSVKKMLKEALPHQANLIDAWELSSLSLFIDELEGYLLNELLHMLDGHELDRANVERSNDIIRLSREAANKVSVPAQMA